MHYIAELFNCNEDLFYTIYDYLRFEKPEKWNFIKDLDDFSFVDVPEMKDLATDACNWLENDLLLKINNWDKESGAPKEWSTLYYMTLSYMNVHNWKTSIYLMDSDEIKFVCKNTILWLRDCINKIK